MSDRERQTELLAEAIDAFNAQDVAAVMSFIHPEVVAHVAAGLGNPGTHHGHEGYVAMMSDWGEAWSENTITLREVEFLDDITALAFIDQRAVGAGSGIAMEFETIFLIGFEGDQAIRFEIHPDRDSALAAL